MKKLKVGILGCGSIAKYRHFPEYTDNHNTEVVAVCDIVSERAQFLADQVEGAQVYSDFNEVIALPEIDIISICLPNYLHAEVTVKALDAGKHVLCEKPMASSHEEAKSMIEAANISGKKFMIGHNQRFVDAHVKAKEIIESGKLGKINNFTTSFGHNGPEPWSVEGPVSWFLDKEKVFSGAMGDLGVHKIDLIRYILDEVTEVGAFVETTQRKGTTEVDDDAVCILKTKSGMVGTLVASWNYINGTNATVIYGSKGILRLEAHPDFPLIEEYSDGTVINHDLQKIQTNEEGGQTASGVIDHFVDCVVNDKKPLIDGEEAYKSFKVILAALESAETKKIITV